MNSQEELLQLVAEECNTVLRDNPIRYNSTCITEAIHIDGEVINYLPITLLNNNFVEIALGTEIPSLKILQHSNIEPDDELYYSAILVSGIIHQRNILHWIKTVVSNAESRKRKEETITIRDKICSIALSRFYDEIGEWSELSD